MGPEAREGLKFAGRAGLFVLILACSIHLLNRFFYTQIAPLTMIQRTEDQFQSCKREVRVLFVGDSHVQNAVNPLEIPGSFNFSSQAENYMQSYYKLRKILEDPLFKPETVGVQIDLHSFARRRNAGFENEWYWKRYIDPLEASRLVEDLRAGQMLVKAYTPIMGHAGYFLFYLFSKFSSRDIVKLVRGHKVTEDVYSDEEDKRRDTLTTVDSIHFATGVAFDERTASFFERTLAFLEEHHIQVLLIKYPVTRTYYDAAVRHVKDPQAFYRNVQERTQPYGNIAGVLDYQMAFFDEPAYFVDGDHLNFKGAEALSRRLAEQIRAPGVP